MGSPLCPLQCPFMELFPSILCLFVDLSLPAESFPLSALAVADFLLLKNPPKGNGKTLQEKRTMQRGGLTQKKRIDVYWYERENV